MNRVWQSLHGLRAYRFLAPTASTSVGVVMLAAFPMVLVPIAQGFAWLCAAVPVLAALTYHLPPIPMSLVLALLALAIGNGLRTTLVTLAGALRFNRALARQQAPLPPRVANIGAKLDLAERLVVLEHPEPAAFCFGFIQTRIAVTTALLERVDDAALIAVLIHERHHAARRDPARVLIVRALSAATFMLPVTDFVRRRIEAQIEIAADREAVRVSSKGALAAGLLAVLGARTHHYPGTVGLTATEARIAHLAGRPALPAIPMTAWVATAGFGVLVAAAMTELFAAAHLVAMVCSWCSGVT